MARAAMARCLFDLPWNERALVDRSALAAYRGPLRWRVGLGALCCVDHGFSLSARYYGSCLPPSCRVYRKTRRYAMSITNEEFSIEATIWPVEVIDL